MSNTIEIKELNIAELSNKAIEIGKQLDGLSVSQSNYILQRVKQDMDSNSYVKYTKVLGLSHHSLPNPKTD